MKILLATTALVLAFSAPALARNGEDSHSRATAISQSSAQSNAANRNNNENKGSVFVAGPGLAAGGITCLGSISGGFGVQGFGASFGTTREDAQCNMRQNAELLIKLGRKGVALQLLLQDPNIARAWNASIRPNH